MISPIEVHQHYTRLISHLVYSDNQLYYFYLFVLENVVDQYKLFFHIYDFELILQLIYVKVQSLLILLYSDELIYYLNAIY